MEYRSEVHSLKKTIAFRIVSPCFSTNRLRDEVRYLKARLICSFGHEAGEPIQNPTELPRHKIAETLANSNLQPL